MKCLSFSKWKLAKLLKTLFIFISSQKSLVGKKDVEINVA